MVVIVCDYVREIVAVGRHHVSGSGWLVADTGRGSGCYFRPRPRSLSFVVLALGFGAVN